MIENGQLEADVPFYMKGRSLARTIMLIDEAEDLTLKQIKLLGSRVADKSNIVFMGDWKQAAGKYEYNCGLVQFIKYVKVHPNPLVGVMVMDEDVRSTASKYFADI
jgi:PhoH-like ATPase